MDLELEKRYWGGLAQKARVKGEWLVKTTRKTYTKTSYGL